MRQAAERSGLLDDWPTAKMEEALANGSVMQPKWSTPSFSCCRDRVM
jgi:hypothetical protein